MKYAEIEKKHKNFNEKSAINNKNNIYRKKKIIKRNIRRISSIIVLSMILVLGVNTIRGLSNVIKKNVNKQNVVVTPPKVNTNGQTNKKKDIEVINKKNGIDEGYEPNDLEVLNVQSNKRIEVRAEAGKNAEQLFEKAAEDGIYLTAVAGYRSYSFQKQLYANEVSMNGEEYANKYVAVPGYSEHHTGLAIDLMSADDVSLTEAFDQTDEFRWLQENMSDYGFILRYPKGKEHITGYNYEPWHIRYVGREAAKEIEELGLTLEEYVDR